MKTPQTHNIRRFETAKNLLEDGMKKNKRIYLLGRGGTGKTYLTWQMEDLIDEYKYKTYPEFDSKLFKKYKIKKSTKAIFCIHSLKEIEKIEKNNLDNLRVINMNKIIHR